jgi:prevent-host-death family protein
MTIVIGAREARQKFADLLGRVGYGKEVAIVERSGKPMVALIPVDLYEQLVAERQARFQVLDRLRSRLPEVSEEEVQQDVSQAIDEVRAGRAARRA